MWFIGDNEQRRAGSIERLPEGLGRTMAVCFVPALHRCTEGIAIVAVPCIRASCAPGGTRFSLRTGPNVSIPWLVRDQLRCPLPPGTEAAELYTFN